MKLEDELYLTQSAEADAAGALSAEARAALNARLAADPDFAQAYHEYYDLIQSLQAGGRRTSFKAMLREVHTEVTAKPQNLFTRIISLVPQRHLRTAAVAASVALFTSAITVWTMHISEPKNGAAVLQNLGQVRREIAHIKSTQEGMKMEINQIKETTDAQTASVNAAVPKSNYSGTGFALNNDGYLLTSYHVVNGAENIQIQTRNGKLHSASVVAFESHADIALLKVDDEEFQFSNSGELPYTLTPNKVALGAAVYTLGFPQDEVVYGEGYIASRNGFEGDSAQYRLELPAGPGQSGAPVIDASGSIIGIIRNKETQTEGTTYAVSSKTLLRLLRDLPKDKRPKLSASNHLSGLSRQQQVEKLQDYTCMVQVYKR